MEKPIETKKELIELFLNHPNMVQEKTNTKVTVKGK